MKMAERIPVTGELQWFWVSARYKSTIIQAPRRKNLWEHVVFVILAEDINQARVLAQEIAVKKEQAYSNGRGSTVQWSLQNIEDIQPLFDKNIQTGTEVFWKFCYKVDPK